MKIIKHILPEKKQRYSWLRIGYECKNPSEEIVYVGQIDVLKKEGKWMAEIYDYIMGYFYMEQLDEFNKKCMEFKKGYYPVSIYQFIKSD